MSDLHTEFTDGPKWLPPDVGADVLVLAGDIVTAPKKLKEYVYRIRETWSREVPIIHTSGNHEYYGRDFSKARHNYTIWLTNHIPNFWSLDRGATVIDGVTFIGATLWTNMADGTHMETARSEMNDFRRIFIEDGGDLFSPELSVTEWRKSVQYIEEMAAKATKPLVVVTHHAPSFRSIPPEYAGNPLNGAYASSLDDLVRDFGAALWVHGHLHSNSDYMIGNTRVVCNPRGYETKDQSKLNHRFNPELTANI
jgi:Icc-related predicted phosphoesterase